MITREKAIVCAVDSPTPIAYLNVYEEGDIWVKIQGCEACTLEHRQKCCGNCPLFTEMGCYWQLKLKGSERARSSDKPWNCVVKPYPDSAMPFCALEYKCVKGSNLGKVRRVRDRGDVFV